MANIFYGDYAPTTPPTAKAGDIQLVRNVENRLGLNHIYRLGTDGMWERVPHDFNGRTGILDYVKELAAQ